MSTTDSRKHTGARNLTMNLWLSSKGSLGSWWGTKMSSLCNSGVGKWLEINLISITMCLWCGCIWSTVYNSGCPFSANGSYTWKRYGMLLHYGTFALFSHSFFLNQLHAELQLWFHMAPYLDLADLAMWIYAVITSRLDCSHALFMGMPYEDNLETPIGAERCTFAIIGCKVDHACNSYSAFAGFSSKFQLSQNPPWLWTYIPPLLLSSVTQLRCSCEQSLLKVPQYKWEILATVPSHEFSLAPTLRKGLPEVVRKT